MRKWRRLLSSRPVRREFAPFEDFIGRVQPRFAMIDPKKGAVERVLIRFEVDERSYLKFKRLVAAGKINGAGSPVALGLADEDGFPRAGEFDHFESMFNLNKGTIGAYGVFPNEDGILLPNMSARVRMTFGPPRSALEVHDEAIFREQDRPFVWIVNKGNIVERRTVRIGQMDGGLRVIEDGLHAEDRVVIAGAKGLRAGAQVEIQFTGEQPEIKKK